MVRHSNSLFAKVQSRKNSRSSHFPIREEQANRRNTVRLTREGRNGKKGNREHKT